MKNKLILFILTALVLLQGTAPAAAAVSEPCVNVAAGYYLDDILYTFVEKNTSAANSKMSFVMEIDGQSAGEAQLKRNVAESCSAHYMLLVDLSTSMPSYKDRISAFAQTLCEANKAKARFSVASFGEKFEVKNTNLTDSEQLLQALNALEYNQNATDICGGVTSALNYLSKSRREPGELVNLVLITDGKPYPSPSEESRQESAEESAKKLKKRLSKASDVIVHSLCFAQWEAPYFDALSAGKGKHATAYSALQAQSFAQQTAEFSDSLYPLIYCAGLNNSVKSFGARLTVIYKNSNKVEAIKESKVRNLNYKRPDTPAETEPEATPGAVPKKSAAKAAENTSPQSSEATQSATDKPQKNSGDAEPAGGDFDFLRLWVIIGACAAALTAVALAVIIVRKSRSAKPSGIKINMKLEDISGNCRNKSPDLVFTGELIIGRKSSCGIVLSDRTAAEQNSRIFIKGNILYIENLDSNYSTAIGGMKIYSPNRLRSGDEITVGKSRFRLRF